MIDSSLSVVKSGPGSPVPPLQGPLVDWPSPTATLEPSVHYFGADEGDAWARLESLGSQGRENLIREEATLIVGDRPYEFAAEGLPDFEKRSSPELQAKPTSWVRPSQPPTHSAKLTEALHDLDAAPQEALEEGFPAPTEVAMRNAARLVRAIYALHTCRLEVYPTVDGEVAIDAPSQRPHSVILLCDAAGGVLCLVNTGRTHRRAHYSDAEQLPDGFLREALAELGQVEQNAA